MRKVSIYIEGERLELFNDESIVINSSYQNYKDLAKIFTDFSQSFTVPASEHNNNLFQHFYQTDVDTTLNFQLRREAKIDIDHTPFRTGKIQLEKANLKNGMPESYTVMFYGDLRSLSDIFGDDKLISLDMSNYTHTYNGNEVRLRVSTATDYDVRYPLISSKRVWTYLDNTTTDIGNGSYPIHYTELFPAIKIKRIFDAIEDKYGITWSGTFLSDKRFTDCFLYLKNKEKFEVYSPVYSVDLTSTDNATFFNTTTDTLQIGYVSIPNASHKVQARVTVSTGTWYLQVFKNGLLYTTLTGDDATNGTTWEFFNADNVQGLNEKFTFKIYGTETTDFDVYVYYQISNPVSLLNVNSYATTDLTTTTQLVVTDVNLADNMPDMRVADFVAGVFKQFNLMCTGKSTDTFQIDTLDEWYAKGYVWDITPYTDINSIDVERIKLYKKIGFEHEESRSFMNTAFKQMNDREYGSLEQAFDYDGEEYITKLPFENLLHQQFTYDDYGTITPTNIQVGYCLEQDTYKPYIPKPILLMKYDLVEGTGFYFDSGSGGVIQFDYIPFGQDIKYNNLNYSLNWGNDISSLLLENVPNSAYQVYYSNYILNLYQAKNRQLVVKATFPISLTTKLRLNDRLVIRDKRYTINEMKSNLTTGEVDLQLILDFRPVKTVRLPKLWWKGGDVKWAGFLPNGAVLAEIEVGASGIVASPSTFTEETIINFAVPENPLPTEYLLTEAEDSFITEVGENYRTEVGGDYDYGISIDYTYENGDIETIEIPLIQAGA
jgi:hypothetical protein